MGGQLTCSSSCCRRFRQGISCLGSPFSPPFFSLTQNVLQPMSDHSHSNWQIFRHLVEADSVLDSSALWWSVLQGCLLLGPRQRCNKQFMIQEKFPIGDNYISKRQKNYVHTQVNFYAFFSYSLHVLNYYANFVFMKVRIVHTATTIH